MVGVCLTVIGLIRVVITLGRADTLADDLLAGDALLFLVSCMLSYWALRSRGSRRMHRLEKIADGIFIVAMIGMVIICAVITYSISVPSARSSTYENRAENSLKIAQVITDGHNTSPKSTDVHVQVNAMFWCILCFCLTRLLNNSASKGNVERF